MLPASIEFRMNIVDLRSDTVTQPGAAMRAAMAAAPVGDDVYGEDPSVRALQDRLAADLGFARGLFMPSGTQANLVALLAHCQRGDEYLVGMEAHTYKYEAGGAAVLGSIQPQPVANADDGSLALELLDKAVKPDDPHFARTRLLALENTWQGPRPPQDYVKRAITGPARAALACIWMVHACSMRRLPAARRRRSWPPDSTRCPCACPRASVRRSVRCCSAAKA
jgi:threonine aldolase